MAHYYLLNLLLLLSALVQQKPAPSLPGPPSGIRIQQNLYMEKHEISNFHWYDYLNDLKQDSSAEAYRRALPDTTVWNEVDRTGILTKRYFRSYRYLFHPVVGISYEQAEAYNKWRSKRDTRKFNLQHKNTLKKLGLEKYRLVYTWRLPTLQEWELAAAGGLDPEAHPYGTREKRYRSAALPGTNVYDSLGYQRPELFKILRQHIRRNPVPGYNTIHTFGNGFRYGLYITNPIPHFAGKRPVTSTRPNEKGFYDMIGNVAEMTSEKGKAKGGSWVHFLAFSKIQMTQTYKAPAAWLGFRAVCEVSLEPTAPLAP